MKNEEWLLVFFEITSFIGYTHQNGNSLEDNVITNADGAEGRFNLAKDWTDKFQEKYENEDWGVEREFYDTLDEFLETSNNN